MWYARREMQEPSNALHASDLSLPHVLLQSGVEVIPPFVEHAFADELEPRCELQRLVFEHGLQIVLADPARVSDLIGVGIKIHVGLDEQYVVD